MTTAAALTLAVLAGSFAKCHAADAFFFDTPPAKRAKAQNKRPANPPPRNAGFVVAAPGAQVILFGQQNGAGGAGDAKDQNIERARPIYAQFKPTMQVELSFVARVCELSDAERDAVAAAAKTSMWDFAIELARTPNRLAEFQQGIWIVRHRNGVGQPRRVETSVEEQIIDAVTPALTPKQREVYEREVTERGEFLKATAIECFVAQLDERLSLTDKQRTDITAALDRGWDDAWAPQLAQFVQMQQYLPAVPDEFVVPHLTPEQKDMWRGIDKISFGGMRNQFRQILPGLAQPIGDVDLGEDP